MALAILCEIFIQIGHLF